MIGQRKMKGFYVTTAVLFFFAFLSFLKVEAGQVLELAKVFFVVQGGVTSLFFGANYGLLWSISKREGVGKSCKA